MIEIMLQVMDRFMMRYSVAWHDASHGLAHAPHPATMGGVSDVVDQFEAEVKLALRHKAAFEKHLGRMYEMLPDMRRANRGPTDIERLSGGLIPRDTASRVTAPVIGTSRKAKEPAPES